MSPDSALIINILPARLRRGQGGGGQEGQDLVDCWGGGLFDGADVFWEAGSAQSEAPNQVLVLGKGRVSRVSCPPTSSHHSQDTPILSEISSVAKELLGVECFRMEHRHLF